MSAGGRAAMNNDAGTGSDREPGVGAWVLTAWVVMAGMLAVIGYAAADDRQAAAGAPLYDHAVAGALQGLRDPAPAAGREDRHPPLPAGYSADEVYWCETCQEYHLRSDAAAPGQVAGAARSAPPDNAVPALPANLSPADWYWCGICRLYHKRQAPDGTPPLPANLAPADYFWCDTCKTYHPHQAPPAPAGEAPSDGP